MMHVVIIGVGAMGCLFGAFLSPLANVTLLGHWPEQLAALSHDRLALIGVDGRSNHYTIQATNDPTAVPPVDLALILVKSHQSEQAAALAKQILAPNGLALTLQNGLGNLEILTAELKPHHTALGTTAQGATMIKPGIVRHAGHGPTYLASTPATAGRLTAVARLFNQAGLTTHLVDNVDGLVWGKLAVNCGINPLTALLGVPNGFLAENEPARHVMMAAARETAVVAQALGVTLPYPDAGQRALEVAQATAANHSSMLQDILRGAPTEIEAICGAVVENGRYAGIPTPVNEKLHQFVINNQRLKIEDLLVAFNL
ncbi:MAG: 2-dehydropantoate 2-reductase [Ardenticatenaceae bacterium]|nr:2-dehydropantoate 2-reductase [Ardenticatenaceae bacterium]MCB9442975.1 2-dehydropantoate 2-reductase [Ardenticatenaceae bacterium]